MIDETKHLTDWAKKESDFRLKERIDDVKFQRDEIKKQKKTACIEEEALKVYKQRALDAMGSLKENALNITQKCIILRETRVGVDLVLDQVDKELRKEIQVIIGCRELLNKVLENCVEQIRRLRACIYLLDRDVANKEKSLQIDETNLKLRENQLEMKTYHGSIPLDP